MFFIINPTYSVRQVLFYTKYGVFVKIVENTRKLLINFSDMFFQENNI